MTGQGKAIMRRLILFRHAKTEVRQPHTDDFDRVLVARGRQDATVIGQALAKAGLAPDLALVSPAARARETWDLAGPAFSSAQVEIRDGLYNATPEEVEAELATHDPHADTVMIVGHNPSLQELGVSLLIEGGASPADIETLSAGFPTATAAVFHIDQAGRASLEALFHARDHRGSDSSAAS
jgi:phosphohistidine phosphatase